MDDAQHRRTVRRRNLLALVLGLAGWVLVMVAIVAGGAFVVRRTLVPMFSESQALPAELARGGAFRGAGFVTERDFVAGSDLGEIRAMRQEPGQTTAQRVTVVVGNNQVLFLNAAGLAQRRRVVLPNGLRFSRIVKLVDVDGKGRFSYLDTSPWEGHVDLTGPAGQSRWRHPLSSGANSIAVGDLDGDGREAILVACNGRGGVLRLAADGSEVWRATAATAWHVEVGRQAGQGIVVHSGANGRLTRLDAAGHGSGGWPWLRTSPGSFINKFALCAYPGVTDPPCAVTLDGRLKVTGLNGRTKLTVKVPYATRFSFGEMAATRVQFRPDGPCYLAVASVRPSWATGDNPSERVLVYLIEPTGKLVYATSLESGSAVLLAVPRADGRGQQLLIGGRNKVVALAQ